MWHRSAYSHHTTSPRNESEEIFTLLGNVSSQKRLDSNIIKFQGKRDSLSEVGATGNIGGTQPQWAKC